ncbi:MAG: SEL1-like repeat protein [Bacteroidales bacterium]|nr:SEL1-like repeat protein [Bacteroidales bacterium]
MQKTKNVFLLVLLCLITLGAKAQNARGIMSAPEFLTDPAEGVYEPIQGRMLLYTFCIGQADGFQRLYFPDEDGKRLGERVKVLFPYAYDVSVFNLPEDPYYRSRNAVIKQLKTAVSTARDGDVVLLYFSGHGDIASNVYVGREYYFVTSDTRADNIQVTGVSGAEIRSYVEQMASKGAFVLVFVDTCHSEALFPSTSGLTGRGGMAFFASSSSESQTVENGLLRSTDFTEALAEMLLGENISGDLTVSGMASVLGAPSSGNVKPKLINASDRVILRSIDKKREYHLRLDRYKDYISRGRAALINGDYARAYFEFSEAGHMEKGLRYTDKENFSEDIRALNKSVSESVDRYAEDPFNDVWKTLSQINDRSNYLDPEDVNLQKLYLGSGKFFFNSADYNKAFSFFKKAYEYGNRSDAPYYMAKIAESYIPGSLDKSEVERLYNEAVGHGYDVEGNGKKREELLAKALSGDVESLFLLGRCYYKGDTLGYSVDYDKAVSWLNRASMKNHPDAIRFLGHCYKWGHGVAEDKKKAHALYKKSASMGSSLAEYYVALDMFNGEGVKQNKKKAIKSFMKLADERLPDALLMLGECFLVGDAVAKDESLAIKYYTEAASLGETLSQWRLGYHYSFKQMPPDYEKGRYWYEKAAEKEDAAALNDLGVIYDQGLGVENNYAQAVSYYMRAAKAGSASGCNNLAYAYYNGQGVTQDINLCVQWLEKAYDIDKDFKSELGLGYYYVGKAYYNGKANNQPVEQNYEKAFRYFKKAEEMGMEKKIDIADLNQCLGICYEDGKGVTKDVDEALRYYRKSAEMGNAEAMNSVGVFYHEGISVQKNTEIAMELFRKAEGMGSVWAVNNIGTHYFYVKRDTLSALPYYKKAAEQGNGNSLFVLGNYYYFGYPGVEQSDESARNYYESAYKLGYKNHGLVQNLGTLYYNQFVLAWNAERYEDAFQSCEKAVKLGYPLALYAKGLFYYYGEVVDKDKYKYYEYKTLSYEKGCRESSVVSGIADAYYSLFAKYYEQKEYRIAAGYCKKAIDTGKKNALYWMGKMYYQGLGLDININRAVEYFDLAYKDADKLTVSERKNLSSIYYDLYAEVSVPKDERTALSWCEKAASLGNASAKKSLPYAKKRALK